MSGLVGPDGQPIQQATINLGEIEIPKDWELKIWPDPSLGKVPAEVKEFDEELQVRCAQLLQLMYESKGVGLAATQVGWDARVFVMDPTGLGHAPMVFVNPLIRKAVGKERFEERCLSFPDIALVIDRPGTVEFSSNTPDGEYREASVSGVIARIFLHEYDHLMGRTFEARASSAAKVVLQKKLKPLRAAKQP